MPKDILSSKLVRFAVKFIGAVFGIVLLASIIIAMLWEGAFLITLSVCMFIGGVGIMGVGALVGAGMSEKRVLMAAHMTGGHRSNYYHEFGKERGRRRDDQFFFMLLMAASGAVLMLLGLLIGV